MEKIKNKLNSQAGESIAETLVSLLIAALALVMLAGAMTTASGVVNKSREKLGGETGYYSKTESLVKMKSETQGIVEISGSGLNQPVDIVYGVNDAFSKTPVIAYKSK